MHICIIIPCYNEANRLPIKEFIEYLGSSKNIDICFVNDGSKDKTINIIENIKSQYPDKVLLVNLENNVGKPEAVRIGILEASKWKCFDYVGFMDADLATPLKEIDVFKKYILEYPECKAFLGSRIQRLGSNIKRSAVRHYFGRVFATFASLTLGIAVYDTQCGAKIFETKIAEKIFLEPF